MLALDVFPVLARDGDEDGIAAAEENALRLSAEGVVHARKFNDLRAAVPIVHIVEDDAERHAARDIDDVVPEAPEASRLPVLRYRRRCQAYS